MTQHASVVRVFLIHGMGRTSMSMALLARRLRAAGHRTSSFGYLVSRTSIPTIVDCWVEHIERTRRQDGDEAGFAVVGHSLGNVLTRAALPRLPDLARFVMLAPPNHPPALARRLAGNRIFRALTGDAGRKLLDEGGFYDALPVPTMPTLILAGTAGPRFARSPWRGVANDGIVSVDETRLVGPAIAHVEVDAIHTLIMNHAEVTRAVLRFLEPR